MQRLTAEPMDMVYNDDPLPEDVQEFVNAINYLADEGFIELDETGNDIRVYPASGA